MPPARRIPGFAIAALLALGAAPAHSAWLPNGTPVADVRGVQMSPNLAPDDSGGAFASWASYGVAPYVQRLTAAGDYAPGWPSVGQRIAIPLLPGGLNEGVTLTPDGTGGVYAVWIAGAEYCQAHCHFEPSRLWAQRLTRAGTPAPGWPAEGVLVARHFISWPPPDVAVAADEGRGLLVAWRENGRAVLVQSISPEGTPRWGDEGLAPGATQTAPSVPALVGDGKGGAFVFWSARVPTRPGRPVLGQHVLESGELSWGADARAVSAPPAAESGFVSGNPVAIADGAQGAIVAWPGRRGAELGLFAARVTHGGGLPWKGDVPVCSAPGDKSWLCMVATSGGDAVLAWVDSRRAPSGDVYAQRLSRGGRANWANDGVPVCTANGSRGPLALAADGADGAYLAWGDGRPEGALYAARLTAGGGLSSGWPEDGALVCARSAEAFPWMGGMSMVPVRGGGAIVAWNDVRYPRPDAAYLEVSSAMLLTPEGPATPPTLASATRGTGRPAVPAGTRASGTLGLTALHAGGAMPGADVVLSLPDAEPATLEVFDVSGRRLWSREVGGLGAGEHVVKIDASGLPAGVYLARLRQGARRATARVVVIR